MIWTETLAHVHTGAQPGGHSSSWSDITASDGARWIRQMIRDRPANELSVLCSHR